MEPNLIQRHIHCMVLGNFQTTVKNIEITHNPSTHVPLPHAQVCSSVSELGSNWETRIWLLMMSPSDPRMWP